MSNSLLTTKQAAKVIGVEVSTLNNSRCKNLLLGVLPPPHIKLGYAVRYRREAIEQWLSSLNEHEIAEGM